jgi:hypothetical protein
MTAGTGGTFTYGVKYIIYDLPAVATVTNDGATLTTYAAKCASKA